MLTKIRVYTKVGPDLKGEGILGDIKRLGIKNITRVQAIKVYRLEGINTKEAKILAEKLLSESINQAYSINTPISGGTNVEIAYKPGVMNPEVSSILKASLDLGIKLIAADSSYEYSFFANITNKKAEEIVRQLHLLNDMVEHIVKEEPKTLTTGGISGKTTIIPIRTMDDEQLMYLSIDKLFLNLEEMKVIQDYFEKIKRDPTDLELETLAQTWSEHCAHKTFKAKIILDGKEKEPFIARIKKEALKHNENIVSAFIDNSGVMDFYDGWAINGKAETHNAPSAIEPYGGAMTGSGGVFRDVVATGQGAKALVSTDIFCLAPPDMETSKLPSGTLPPDYILKRVVTAVKDYGNRVGIPSNNGSFHFHDDFRAKPIVLVGAYGILPKSKAKKASPKIGDIALVVGGATGRDGIHGATFSSAEMSDRTISVNATAVQIGNAIEEKRTFDAILQARDENLIRLVQDLGAGGLSSAIGETGQDSGVTVNLEKAPTKYPGMSPWEIWVSESQERMLVVIHKKNLKRFLAICKKYNVEASEIAKFDGSKRLQVYFGKKKLADLEMKFLHNGLPQRVMKATQFSPTKTISKKTTLPVSEKDWIKLLKKILSSGDINSKEPVLRLYDHNVQGTNALHPFSGEKMDGPNDASIVRPLLDKPYGMVVSHGLNPGYTNKDPYWGSIWAGAEAISNYVAVGGDYKNASLINNYIWPVPNEEWLGKLDQCVSAVCDFMKSLKVPVISGKDSLSATYRGTNGFVLNSPATLVMSVFGKIPNVKKTVSADFKKTDSTIVLVGIQDLKKTDEVPKVDLEILPQVLEKIHQAIIGGKVLACHDVSEGGLITSVFEMCVGGNCGVQLHLEGIKAHLRGDFLFNETPGCFIVEVENEKIADELFKGIFYQILGKTQPQQTLTVSKLFSVDIGELKGAWQKPMKEIFG